ncbi:MAG TPA: pyridoxal-phosphate dependent enzyme [Candidatus Dormibacteraeota bacterium]|nr:pyridoxal-phosphate dependent enzyme [Candidatus Dormibacteraeota bacterium]
MTERAIAFDDVREAARRLAGVAHRTPVMRVGALDERAGTTIHLKCENLQRVGAFKFRGAYNTLSQLTDDERARGVVAFSSGNHAQGVALAARLLGVSATIVMPHDAPRAKLAATEGYGARVVTYDRYTGDRDEAVRTVQSETGAIFVPPYDDPRIMAGQGTAALELLEEVPELDALFVPVGGGGLLSSSCVVAAAVRPGLRVYGVETEAANDWWLSWRAGERVRIEVPRTVADGIQTTAPGVLTWPIVRDLAAGIVLVSDEEAIEAMRLLLERGKLLAEPSGAAALAAPLFRKVADAGRNVGVILSGGNVDLARLATLLA